MSPALLAAFVAASVVLMLIPGPNVALIVAASVERGTRHGLATVAGTVSGIAIQLVVNGLGLASVLAFAGSGFTILRWIGAAYLVWLGVVTWRRAPQALDAGAASPRSLGASCLRGFAVSMTNPKILLFLAAFFPQFVTGPHPGGQIVVLSAIFLAAAVVIDSGWAFMAARARALLVRHAPWRNRLTGGVLIAAGLGLAAARTVA